MDAHRVLFVDDDPDTRELYQILLEMSGYAVSGCPTVRDGLSRARQFSPDVIVTDWRLPDGDAFTLLEGLHRNGHTRHIPVIGVTGITLDAAGLDRARDLGCSRVYLKPLAPEALLGAIRRALDGRADRRLRAAALRIQRAARVLEEANASVDLPTLAAALANTRPASDVTNVAVLFADDGGRCIAANRLAVQLTGYGHDELIRLCVWDLTQPLAGESRSLWRQFISAGHQEGACMVRCRSGESVEMRYAAIANIAPGLHLSALAAVPSPAAVV